MSSDTESRTIETYGPARIAHTAAQLPGANDAETTPDERYELQANATDELVDELEANTTPIERIIFAHAICNEYNVGQDVPADQRKDAVYADDWRDGVLYGLWHLVNHAILKARERRLSPTEDTLEPSQGMDYTVTYDAAKLRSLTNDLTNQAEQYATDENPDTHALDACYDEEMERRLTDLSFVETLLTANSITKQYDLKTWPCMTDTAVRESFAYEHFCTVVESTILIELVMSIDPATPSKQPVTS